MLFLVGKKVATKEKRWYKEVGLGFKTPAEAINGTYIGESVPPTSRACLLTSCWTWFVDKKCPFTGDVSIRGRILTGKVVSTKMTRTIVIRRDYLHYIPKYSAPFWFILCYVGLPVMIQTVTRKDTRTWPFMYRLLSVWSSVTL